jgi:hypothetical protein
MKRAFYMILGVSLAAATFSGVLIYRELFDMAGPAFFAEVTGVKAPFTYSMCLYGFAVDLLVALGAVAGLIAAHRVPERLLEAVPLSRSSRRLTVLASRAYPMEPPLARSVGSPTREMTWNARCF